jgi:hypothetical protein
MAVADPMTLPGTLVARITKQYGGVTPGTAPRKTSLAVDVAGSNAYPGYAVVLVLGLLCMRIGTGGVTAGIAGHAWKPFGAEPVEYVATLTGSVAGFTKRAAHV